MRPRENSAFDAMPTYEFSLPPESDDHEKWAWVTRFFKGVTTALITVIGAWTSGRTRRRAIEAEFVTQLQESLGEMEDGTLVPNV